MKALRIVLAILAGASVLLLVVAVIAIRSFDLNDYKDEITAFVQERTGRTLTIEENIEFSLFPWFAVETGGVTLSDDPDFGDRSFVTVDTLSARVRVWPLLKRRIEVGRVVFDGVNLNLGIDAEGVGNWESMLQASAPTAPELEMPAPDRPAFEALAVEGISLINTRILWHDADGEVTHIARDVTLVTGPINDDDPVDVSVSLSVLDVAYQASAEIELETVASIRPQPALSGIEANVRVLDSRQELRASGTLTLGSIELDAGIMRAGPASVSATLVRPPFVPGELAFESEFASLEFNPEDESVVLDGLSARSGTLEARFNVRGETVVSDPRVLGSIELQSQSLADLFRLLDLEPPAGLGDGVESALAAVADLDLRLTTQELTIDRFVLSALGIDASGRAEHSADQRLSAAIELPEFAPSDPLLALVSPYIPDGVNLGAISAASLTAELAYAREASELELTRFSARLDAAELNGRLRVDDISSPDEISGTIAVSGLDDRLLGALFGDLLPSELSAAELGEFRLGADFDYDPGRGTTALDPIEIAAYGLSADGQLNISTAGDSLALSGRAALDEFSPRELLARFGLPIPASGDP
ncbi:MAG TPA: AsmA family protein, partial [Gammaproteobacteria bacterium]